MDLKNIQEERDAQAGRLCSLMRRAPRVRLGDLIAEYDERCGERPSYLISGVDINKNFIKSVANISETNLPKYKVVRPNQFAANMMHVGRDLKIPLALNNSQEEKLVSPAYFVFQIKPDKEKDVLHPYLQMVFSRSEFDRLAAFYCDGSIRGNLGERFLDLQIPLPSIEVQRELVAVYEGLRQTAEQNEAMLKPLSDACHAYIVDCKEKYPSVKLGEYIEVCDERNKENRLPACKVRGISTEKKLIDTKANLAGVSLQSYKIIKPTEFVYVADTSRRGDKMALALNSTNEELLVSSIYTVFRSKDKEQLLPEYLYLIFARDEFDRYARFNSWGSARETFDWAEMERVQIPLPPIEVQKSIVSLYRCAEEAKEIAKEARELMRTICPALIQRARNTGVPPVRSIWEK